jgi:hypothetical protein
LSGKMSTEVSLEPKKTKTKMIYEPLKTKKYILIGVGAVILAVLAIVITPLLYKSKTVQTPAADPISQQKLQQQKIQAGFDQLDSMRKDSKPLTQEEVQKGFAELEKQRKKSQTPQPTPEQIQAGFDKLDQMKNQ